MVFSERLGKIAETFAQKHDEGRQPRAERVLEESIGLASRIEGRMESASVDLQGKRTGPGGEDLDHRVSGGEIGNELPDVRSLVRPHPGFHHSDPSRGLLRGLRFEERAQEQAELVDEQVQG